MLTGHYSSHQRFCSCLSIHWPFVLVTVSPAVGGASVVTTSILCLFVLATLSSAVGGARVVTMSILIPANFFGDISARFLSWECWGF